MQTTLHNVLFGMAIFEERGSFVRLLFTPGRLHPGALVIMDRYHGGTHIKVVGDIRREVLATSAVAKDPGIAIKEVSPEGPKPKARLRSH